MIGLPMLRRGSNTWVRSLLLLVLSAILSAIISHILKNQTLKTTINSIGVAVFEMLKKVGFSATQAMFITAQAAHETANFSSAVFKNANNCFGFKYIGHALEIGSYNGYGKYDSVKDCVTRYRDYYKKRNWPDPFNSVDQFVSSLKANKYFEDTYDNYLRGVNHYMKVYFS